MNLTFGGLSRAELHALLREHAVALNESAEQLLARPEFDSPEETSATFAITTPEDLGLAESCLSELIAVARMQGLAPLPLIAAPWLRLAMLDLDNSTNSTLRGGKAPRGAVTVVSTPPVERDQPTGLYIRTVDGQRWLRGYHCTDEYLWPADSQLAFAKIG